MKHRSHDVALALGMPGWMLVAVLGLATPCRAEPAPAPAAPRPGEALAPLQGRNLAGEAVALPAVAAGRTALLALGFSYESRHAVEAWGERFRAEFGADSQVTFFELPMMAGIGARMARPFIEGGMRGGTPRALHRNVIVVWSDVGRWRRALGVRDPDLAYLLLLDPAGRVLWSGTGGREVAGFEGLATRVRAARSR